MRHASNGGQLAQLCLEGELFVPAASELTREAANKIKESKAVSWNACGAGAVRTRCQYVLVYDNKLLRIVPPNKLLGNCSAMRKRPPCKSHRELGITCPPTNQNDARSCRLRLKLRAAQARPHRQNHDERDDTSCRESQNEPWVV